MTTHFKLIINNVNKCLTVLIKCHVRDQLKTASCHQLTNFVFELLNLEILCILVSNVLHFGESHVVLINF